MFEFLNKLKKKTPIAIEVLEQQVPGVDFEAIISTLTELSASAQLTFLYRYLQHLPHTTCKSLLRYTKTRMSLTNDILIPSRDEANWPSRNSRESSTGVGLRHFTSKPNAVHTAPVFGHKGEGPESSEELA